MKLYKKIFIHYEMELITGLRVGDSKENAEIGGVDATVVRRKDNNQPYIPGSSLKGKIRSLLDVAHGQTSTTEKGNHPIGKLFGATKFDSNKEKSDKNEGNPSRLIVRDAYLTEDVKDKDGKVITNGWATKLYESEFTDLPYTEIKFENVINRITGKAEDLRQIERIPAGAKFNVEFVLNCLGDTEMDAENNGTQFKDLLLKGIKLLQADYLGGSGSRGYGQVKFGEPEINEMDVQKEIINT